jgi:hypothetical protein
MSVDLADFKLLVNRDGPITVVDSEGRGITHATSGIAKPVDPTVAQVLSLEEIQLVLFDEMSNLTRTIRGDQIKEITKVAPGWRIVVDETVDPDEGKTVRTRGA